MRKSLKLFSFASVYTYETIRRETRPGKKNTTWKEVKPWEYGNPYRKKST
jgi:hypothetical protein